MIIIINQLNLTEKKEESNFLSALLHVTGLVPTGASMGPLGGERCSVGRCGEKVLVGEGHHNGFLQIISPSSAAPLQATAGPSVVILWGAHPSSYFFAPVGTSGEA